MMRSRFLLFGIATVLLIIASTGVYLYHNLPGLLRQQALRALQTYGMEDLDYTGLTFTARELAFETLTLSGTYENLVYTVKLTSGTLHYDWRTALNSRFESLALSGVDLSIHSSGAGASDTIAPIRVDQLVPQTLMAHLPTTSLVINHWQLDYQPTSTTVLSANGSLKIDGQLDLDLNLNTILAGREVAAAIHASAANVGLDAIISLRNTDTALADATLALRPEEGARWKWHLQGSVHYAPVLHWLQQLNRQQEPGAGIAWADAAGLQGSSVFDVQVGHGNELTLGSAKHPIEHVLRQMRARIHLRNSIQRLDIPSLARTREGTSAGILDIDATYDAGQLTASVPAFSILGELWTARLPLSDDTKRGLGWAETIPVSLEIADPITVAYSKEGVWSMQLRSGLLSLGENDTRIRLQKLNLDASVNVDEPQQVTTQLTSHVTSPLTLQMTASLNTRLRNQLLPQLELALTQRGSIEESVFTLRVADAAESFDTDLDGNLHLLSGAGNFSLSTTIKDLAYFSASTLPLLRAFDLLDTDMEIRSGTVQLTSTIESKDFDLLKWKQQSQASIANVSGSLQGYRFEGLSVTADWSGITHWKTSEPVQISLAKLVQGVTVSDINLRMSLPEATPIERPKLRIDAFSAEMFSGDIALSEPLFWDFAATSNHLTLHADDWQLGALVALQPNTDIRAQGTLQGELPLTFSDGRIIINRGYLRAIPPGGSIRYVANEKTQALANSNSELALAIDLLSDFQYQVLSTDVQLDKAGNLLLGLSLGGSNPAQHDGQAVNFSINVEQNLDPLLQSLRLSDNVSKRIEGKLK